MSAPPPRTPADWLAAIVMQLSLTLDGHSTWGRLPRPLALLILDRLRAIQQRFRRIADRISAGKYLLRRSAAPRRHTDKRPRRPNPPPHSFGWLIKLVLETAPYGGQLQYLFADAEMAALMAAAPASMRRPLRSLCRMLGVTPPRILEIPKSPSPARQESEGPAARRRESEGVAAAPRVPSPAPPHPQPSITPHACGPPLPA